MLTCAVLTALGLLALVRVDGPRSAAPAHRGTLLSAGSLGRGASPGVGPPDPVLPLFPTTSMSIRGVSTTTARSPGSAASARAADAKVDLPAPGTYTYAVDGNEEITGGGRRALPPTMTLSAHRGAGIASDEIALDMKFSDQHVETEVVSLRPDRLGLRSETMNAKFGLVTRASQASYNPVIARAALPFGANAVRSGATEARDGGGALLRVEDWKVTDVASRSTGWEVVLERTSRPGAVEQLRETRRGWFDITRGTWTTWETHLHTERTNGVKIAYDLNYTATLTGFTPA